MSKKYVEDIRRIAKTDEILKKLPNITLDKDKGSILSNRGIGYTMVNNSPANFDPCQFLYTTDDGSYTFANIVDGLGPKLQDGTNNHCAIVNSITGMREIGVSPTLRLILKPDGIFAPISDGYLYASQQSINAWYAHPELFDADNKWAFASPQECYDFTNYYYATIERGESPVAHALVTKTVTQEQIGVFNFSTSYPLYGALYEAGTTHSKGVDFVFGLPFNYDYTIDGRAPGATPPIIESPIAGGAEPLTDANSAIFGSMDTFTGIFDYSDLATREFQLALSNDDGLWHTDGTNPLNPVKYSSGVSSVIFEFGPTYARTGMVRPAKDGGFALFETSSGNPTGSCYVFRRNRTLAAVVPAAQLTSYLA